MGFEKVAAASLPQFGQKLRRSMLGVRCSMFIPGQRRRQVAVRETPQNSVASRGATSPSRAYRRKRATSSSGSGTVRSYIRLPLGWVAFLHLLRGRFRCAVVRGLRRYYHPSDFPPAFIPAFPSVTFSGRPWISRFSRLELRHMHRVWDSAVPAHALP